MALVVPNASEQRMLESIVGKTAVEGLTLSLYTNNGTPAETDTVANYTEATGNGYASISLTGSSWTSVAGDPSYVTYPQQTFTFTGALGNVYGYFIKGTTSGALYWAERFSNGPYNVAANGDTIKITLRLELS